MGLKQITVRLPRQLAGQLEELAHLEGRSVAEEVRTLLEDAIRFAVDLTPTSELEARAAELARSRLRWDPEALRRRINSLEAQRREIEQRLRKLREQDISYRLALIDDLRRVEEDLEEARADMRRWGDALAAARAEVARDAVRPVCEFLNEIAEDLAAALDWLLDVGEWARDPALGSVAWGSFRERIRQKLNRPSPVQGSWGKSGDVVKDVISLCLRA